MGCQTTKNCNFELCSYRSWHSTHLRLGYTPRKLGILSFFSDHDNATRNKKMTAMIDNKECPKCSSEKIECKDDKFTCNDCGLFFHSFGVN